MKYFEFLFTTPYDTSTRDRHIFTHASDDTTVDHFLTVCAGSLANAIKTESFGIKGDATSDLEMSNVFPIFVSLMEAQGFYLLVPEVSVGIDHNTIIGSNPKSPFELLRDNCRLPNSSMPAYAIQFFTNNSDDSHVKKFEGLLLSHFDPPYVKLLSEL